MLLAENQVIERNIDHLPAGNVILVDALNDDAISEFATLRPDINWYVFTPFFDTYKTLQNTKQVSKNNIFFGPWLTAPSELTFDAAIIYYPKAKLRFDYYLSNLSQHLATDATIYAVGEKKGGVKGCNKAMSSYVIKANKLDSARHCMLFAGAFNGQVDNKSITDWYSKTRLDIEVSDQTVTLDLMALPGVFSANRLDEGTELLLKSITEVKGHGLDFGVGCGVISAALSARYNVSMVGVDVDALAVASSNQTFTVNKIDANAICSDGLSELLNGNTKFDFIVTNPPFHTGIKTDYSMTENFVKQSKSILAKKYQLWMVANAFLPYPELIQKHLVTAKTVNNNNRFNIYHASASN